jgi:hypothetical protein
MPPRSDQSSERTKTPKTPKMPKAPFGIRIGQTIISELRGAPHEHEMRRSRSGPLHPWSARSRLVEHNNPAHANPTAQVLAARRDDRPATRRRTTDRKHPRFVDRIRAPHNRYIATPINARNVCDRKSLTGATRRCGDYNGSSIAGARERRRTCGAYGAAADRRLRPHRRDGGPTPACPQKEAAAHSAQPNAYPL